ncbi:peptidyl-tRNA hydrolase [Candidatus Micrarchaeota archaeon]|nr:peptidyl-tRNA hydrolase [Candidatus Micrarchaeota archaeon]
MMRQVIIVRTDLNMKRGKIAAQASHAAVTAMLKTEKIAPEVVKQWLKEGQKKVVLKVSSEKELINIYKIVSKSVPAVVIRDAGRTQIAPDTVTCIGIGPWYDDILDKLTSHLKLL